MLNGSTPSTMFREYLLCRVDSPLGGGGTTQGKPPRTAESSPLG